MAKAQAKSGIKVKITSGNVNIQTKTKEVNGKEEIVSLSLEDTLAADLEDASEILSQNVSQNGAGHFTIVTVYK